MKLTPFKLERYFAEHEFTAEYLLSNSDCEALSMSELLDLADAQAKKLWDDLRLGYTETTGHPLLKEEISKLYENASPQNIVVTAPQEGIFIAMNALLHRGDHVVCTFPGYQSLYTIAESLGCEVSAWRPREHEGWRFDLEDLTTELRSSTKLIVINFPHNPTGALLDASDFSTLIRMVDERGIHLFSDEMYRFLELDTQDRLPSACDEHERALTLFGMSKTFGLPGLRIGWIATRDAELLERMCILKDYTTICSSAPSEVLAVIGLRAKQEIIALQRTRIKNNLALLDEFFARYRDLFDFKRPLGGSICFPRLLVDQGARGFCETAAVEESIMLVPSSLFDYGNAHIRIGFGRQDMPRAIERLSSFLDRYYR